MPLPSRRLDAPATRCLVSLLLVRVRSVCERTARFWEQHLPGASPAGIVGGEGDVLGGGVRRKRQRDEHARAGGPDGLDVGHRAVESAEHRGAPQLLVPVCLRSHIDPVPDITINVSGWPVEDDEFAFDRQPDLLQEQSDLLLRLDQPAARNGGWLSGGALHCGSAKRPSLGDERDREVVMANRVGVHCKVSRRKPLGRVVGRGGGARPGYTDTEPFQGPCQCCRGAATAIAFLWHRKCAILWVTCGMLG